MMTKIDHEFCLKACQDPRATKLEKEFLSNLASLWAAGETISRSDYGYMQVLTGGHLSTITPIFSR